MTFTSYAQNFEDVMLWRALKHIQDGHYVDVGAQHPVVDSVSKAFYERGWRGIHFEPVPEYANLLRADRPDETVLQVAASDTNGSLILNVIADTGLSTAVDAHAANHTQAGFEGVRVAVAQLTLAEALRGLVQGEVHWMKIDVEGFEEQVLKGWNSDVMRPWIIVVEATKPLSSEADHATWEPLLIRAMYSFVYFDGLNRFYVAQEHPELVESFACPPNVFDGVRLSGLASSELCKGLLERQVELESALRDQISTAHNLCAETALKYEQATLRYEEATSKSMETALRLLDAESRADISNKQALLAEEKISNQAMLLNEAERERFGLHTLLQEVEKRYGETYTRLIEIEYLRGQTDLRALQAQTRLSESDHQIAALAHRVQALQESRSWRLTAPVRAAGTGLRKVKRGLMGSFTSPLRRSAKRMLTTAFNFADAHPKFRTFTGKVAHRTHVYRIFLDLYVRLIRPPEAPQQAGSLSKDFEIREFGTAEPRLRARAATILAELEFKIGIDKSESIK